MKKIKGLGDLLAIVLYPVGLILKLLGYEKHPTPRKRRNVLKSTIGGKSCGCKARQDKLNQMFPFK
jgi:hypothetical protein